MQQLSKREINILLQLLDTEMYLTTQEMAQKHSVSVRTIKYDLDNVRNWLNQRSRELKTKRSKGVWLDLSDVERMKLKSELLDVERFDLYPDQELRIDRLIFHLLLSKSAISSQKLADYLEVSKNTILNDLDQLEEIIIPYHLVLQRQARFGVRLIGEEIEIRLLMEQICQKHFTDYDIFQIMNQLIHPEKHKKREIFAGANTIFQKIYDITLFEMGRLLQSQQLESFDYPEILSIILRVAIAASRLKEGFTIGSYQLLGNQALFVKKQELSFLLMERIFQQFDLPILEAEYFYVYSDEFENAEAHDIVALTEHLITVVSEKMNFPFSDDVQLFSNLLAHLSLQLSRKQRFINEYNPFLEDIRKKHSKIFNIISNLCQELMPDSAVFLNESFMAYIVLHFLVSYEKLKESSTVRIVYVCSTGLGVTSLIRQKVSEEILNVEIASFASVLNAKEVIQSKNPDLVVSIFPLDPLDRPFVKVQPLPTSRDILRIQEEVKKIVQNGVRKAPKLSVEKLSIDFCDVENFSRELIVKSYMIFEELWTLLQKKVVLDYREAFLLHVLLMVHRITFNQQYENESNIAAAGLSTQKELVEKIEELFLKNDLYINHSEISALLIYCHKGD
ncbi:MAG: HTH domain-containing protein [Streptococcaceae bacterium]|jgi:transcriptional antiterminator|nr:HTH domain-containing protein [Streptococcaceae bacterium]